MERLMGQLRRHEIFHGFPFADERGMLTIGYGRRLAAHPLTQEEGAHLLERDLRWLQPRLIYTYPIVDSIGPVRRAALLNMAYSLGITGIIGLTQMWAAIEAGAWNEAADEIMGSYWARQTKSRAHDIAYMLRTGEWPDMDQ